MGCCESTNEYDNKYHHDDTIVELPVFAFTGVFYYTKKSGNKSIATEKEVTGVLKFNPDEASIQICEMLCDIKNSTLISLMNADTKSKYYVNNSWMFIIYHKTITQITKLEYDINKEYYNPYLTYTIDVDDVILFNIHGEEPIDKKCKFILTDKLAS